MSIFLFTLGPHQVPPWAASIRWLLWQQKTDRGKNISFSAITKMKATHFASIENLPRLCKSPQQTHHNTPSCIRDRYCSLILIFFLFEPKCDLGILLQIKLLKVQPTQIDTRHETILFTPLKMGLWWKSFLSLFRLPLKSTWLGWHWPIVPHSCPETTKVRFRHSAYPICWHFWWGTTQYCGFSPQMSWTLGPWTLSTAFF